MKQCTCYALRAVDCTCKPAKYGELYTSPTAKQEQGEPAYWLGYGLQAHTEKPFDDATPLYTTPQQRKPLTDEQIMDALNLKSCEGYRVIVRAIEAAHGIKADQC